MTWSGSAIQGRLAPSRTGCAAKARAGRTTPSAEMKRRRCRRLCFFFQAEDGIRDVAVTGVQTCALPISYMDAGSMQRRQHNQIDVEHLHQQNPGGHVTKLTRMFFDRAQKQNGERPEEEIGRASCRERV